MKNKDILYFIILIIFGYFVAMIFSRYNCKQNSFTVGGQGGQVGQWLDMINNIIPICNPDNINIENCNDNRLNRCNCKLLNHKICIRNENNICEELPQIIPNQPNEVIQNDYNIII